MRKIPESAWGWIVPVVLLFWILVAMLTGCWPVGSAAAHAAGPTPSSTPAPDPAAGIALNAGALVATAAVLAVVMLLVWRSIMRNSE